MSTLRNMYSSRVVVMRSTKGSFKNGAPTFNYTKLTTMLDYYLDVPGEIMCRIDLNWITPGITQAPAYEAGKAPTRVGTVFFDFYEHQVDNDFVAAGDYLMCVAGPVTGTFEVRVPPRPALDLFGVSHMEVEVVEIDKQLTGVFPRVTPL